MQARLSWLFSEVRVLSEGDLDDAFSEEFSNVLNSSHVGFGYWLWKPQAVLQVARSLREGTPLVYMDLGCHLYPFIPFDWNPLIELTDVSPSGIVGFQDRKQDPSLAAGSAEAVWTKGDLFDYFGARNDRGIYETPQFAATSFIMRVDARSLGFLEAWLQVARDDLRLFDDSPSISPNLPGFTEHRFDQSIFSLLCKTLGCSRLPQDLLQARRFRRGTFAIPFLPWVAARDLSGFPANFMIWARVIFRLFLSLVLPRRAEAESSRIPAPR